MNWFIWKRKHKRNTVELEDAITNLYKKIAEIEGQVRRLEELSYKLCANLEELDYKVKDMKNY